MTKNHKGPLLHILFLRRPITIDFIDQSIDLEIGIIVLDESVSVCGVKTYSEQKWLNGVTYGPDKIQAKNQQDLKINVKLCEYV